MKAVDLADMLRQVLDVKIRKCRKEMLDTYMQQHKKHLAEDTNNAAANLDTHKVVNEVQAGRQTVF